MTALSIWEWLLILVLVTTVANGFIAHHKRRSIIVWVILGLMFNPFAFLVLLFLPSNRWNLPLARDAG
jgi:hypothetical protein